MYNDNDNYFDNSNGNDIDNGNSFNFNIDKAFMENEFCKVV